MAGELEVGGYDAEVAGVGVAEAVGCWGEAAVREVGDYEGGADCELGAEAVVLEGDGAGEVLDDCERMFRGRGKGN